jgi:hypothetical protein
MVFGFRFVVLLCSCTFACELVYSAVATTTFGAEPQRPLPGPQIAQSSMVSGVVASVDQGNLMIIMRTRFGQAQGFAVSSPEILKGINRGDTITVELDSQGVARRITKVGTPELSDPQR